jgi:hypothetical protein
MLHHEPIMRSESAISAELLNVATDDSQVQFQTAQNRLCHFCRRNPADANNPCNEEVHLLLRRTHKEHIYRTQYLAMEIDVPRCPRCMRLHKVAENMILICLAAAIGAGLYFAIPRHPTFDVVSFITTLIIAIPLSLACGWPITALIDRGNLNAKHFPPIERLRQDGWKMGGEPHMEGKEINQDMSQAEFDKNRENAIKDSEDILTSHGLSTPDDWRRRHGYP